MDVGAYVVGVVKTNKKVFCKKIIENLKKDWPGGSYLVLNSKPMVSGDSSIIGIDYKYNARKVLYLIVTDESDIPKAGITCLYK